MGKSFRNLILLLVTILLLGIVFVFFSSFHDTFFSASNTDTIPTSIFVSLAPKDDPLAPVSTYTLDPQTGELNPFLSASGSNYIGTIISPDNLLYAATEVNSSGSVIIIVDSVSGNALPLTGDRAVVIRRNPSWSPLGTALAYEGRSDTKVGGAEPESWSVYYYDLQTQTETFLTTGMNPIFTPIGQLLILRNDGLYMVDPVQRNADGTTVVVKLWGIENGQAVAEMRFALSLDGSHLAWVSRAEGKINLIAIASWFPFVAEIESEISSTIAASPVFSPDGLSLVYAEADGLTADGQPQNPRITSYNFSTKAKRTVLDLTPFDTNSFFITDWK